MVLAGVVMFNFSIIKKYSFLFLMLSVFIPSEIFGMHHEQELDKMKINNLYDDWYIAVETSNIQGYVDSLDENIVLIPPGGAVIQEEKTIELFLVLYLMSLHMKSIKKQLKTLNFTVILLL